MVTFFTIERTFTTLSLSLNIYENNTDKQFFSCDGVQTL